MAEAVVVEKDPFDAAFEEAVNASELVVKSAGDAEAGAVPPKKEENSVVVKPVEGEEISPKKEDPFVLEKTATELAVEAITKAQEVAQAKAATKAAEDAATVAATKAAEDAAAAAAAREAPYMPDDAEKLAMEKFEKEFPNEYKAMQARLKQERQSVSAEIYKQVQTAFAKIADVEKGIKPLADTVETQAYNEHFAAIKGAHADYDAVVKDLPAWIETLPQHRQIGAQAVYKQGNAQAVIDLVADYKTAKGIIAPVVEIPPKKEEPKPAPKKGPTAEEVAAGTPVMSKRTAPSVKGAPDKEDFDGAWAEATKDE